jgi:hypothetical protein
LSFRFTARQRARSAVQAQVVEADAEQQLEPRPDLLHDLPSGIRAAAGRLHRGEKRVQLVEVLLPQIVNRLAGHREEQPRRPQPRAVTVRTRVLDHDLVEPRFHPGARLAALAVPAVPALDPPCDAVKTDFLPLNLVRLDLGVRRHAHRNLPRLDAVQNRLACAFRQVLPGRVEAELQVLRQAVHHAAVPRVGVVAVRLADETAANDASLRVGNQQLRMRELVDAKAAARATRALGIVEHEIAGPDVAVHEVMGRAAQP